MRKQEKIFLIGIIILLSAVIPYTIFKAKIVQEGEPTPITYYYQSFYNTTEQWGLHDVPESTFIADINEGYLMDNSTTIEHFYYDYTKESHPILVDNMASCIEFANGYWWVSGWQNNHIYKYYENWTYTGVYVPLGMIASFRYELGYWWVISMMDGQIHKYYTNWTHTGFSRPITNQEVAPQDFTLGKKWNEEGDFWFVIGYSRYIFIYDIDWTFTGYLHDTSRQTTLPYSVEFYNDSFYVANRGTTSPYESTIYKYQLDGRYTGDSFTIKEDYVPFSMRHFNISWWILGGHHNTVFRYNDTTYDISKFNQGEGRAYCQTNQLEKLAIRSQNNLGLELTNTSIMDLDFYSTSPNPINFSLLHEGVAVKNYSFEKNIEFVYSGDSTDIIAQDRNPVDINFVDGYWWVLGSRENAINKYYENWTYTGISIPFSNWVAFEFANGYWWVGDSNERIYKYNLNWTYAGQTIIVSMYIGDIGCIEHADGNFYILDTYGTKYVHKFNSNWIYQGKVTTLQLNTINIDFIDGYWWQLNNKNYDGEKRVTLWNLDWTPTGIYYNFTENLPYGYTPYFWDIEFYNDTFYISSTSYTTEFVADVYEFNLVEYYNSIVECDEELDVDQLEFSGLFDDGEYLTVNEIKIYEGHLHRPNITFWIPENEFDTISQFYNYTVNVEVEDVDELPIYNVEFSLYNPLTNITEIDWEGMGNGGNSFWNFTFDPIDFDNGLYNFIVRARDNVGYGIHNISIYIINERPTITFITPQNLDKIEQIANYNINCSVYDLENDNFSTPEIMIYQNSSNPTVDWTPMGQNLQYPEYWIFTINPIDFENEVYMITVRANDTKGYENKTIVMSFQGELDIEILSPIETELSIPHLWDIICNITHIDELDLTQWDIVKTLANYNWKNLVLNPISQLFEANFNLTHYEYGDYYLIVKTTINSYHFYEVKEIQIHPLMTYNISEVSYTNSDFIISPKASQTPRIRASITLEHHPIVKERDFEIYLPSEFNDAFDYYIIRNFVQYEPLINFSQGSYIKWSLPNYQSNDTIYFDLQKPTLINELLEDLDKDYRMNFTLNSIHHFSDLTIKNIVNFSRPQDYKYSVEYLNQSEWVNVPTIFIVNFQEGSVDFQFEWEEINKSSMIQFRLFAEYQKEEEEVNGGEGGINWILAGSFVPIGLALWLIYAGVINKKWTEWGVSRFVLYSGIVAGASFGLGILLGYIWQFVIIIVPNG